MELVDVQNCFHLFQVATSFKSNKLDAQYNRRGGERVCHILRVQWITAISAATCLICWGNRFDAAFTHVRRSVYVRGYSAMMLIDSSVWLSGTWIFYKCIGNGDSTFSHSLWVRGRMYCARAKKFAQRQHCNNTFTCSPKVSAQKLKKSSLKCGHIG